MPSPQKGVGPDEMITHFVFSIPESILSNKLVALNKYFCIPQKPQLCVKVSCSNTLNFIHSAVMDRIERAGLGPITIQSAVKALTLQSREETPTSSQI